MPKEHLTLNEKLMNIQHELKAPKNLRNNFGGYNYRNAESILEALKPLLIKYGATVAITDTVEEIGGRIYIKATATIYDAENPSFEPLRVTAYAREAESKKGMDDAQVTGATSSYARKYALNGLFLLDDTQDVDTEAYQKAERAPQSTTQTKSNKTTPRAKAKPQSATQDAPASIPEPAILTADARVELRSFIKANNLDGHSIAQACGLNEGSTAKEYQDALVYAKSLLID